VDVLALEIIVLVLDGQAVYIVTVSIPVLVNKQ
jgi:hypothetical protein